MKLVLLPGLDGTGVLFRPFLAVAKPEIEPVVVSYPTRVPLGYDDLLPRVRSALPRNEPFVLLGESFSGPLSIRIAAERPPGLAGLILAGSFVSCPIALMPTWAAHCVPEFPFRSFPLYAKLKARFTADATSESVSLSFEALSQVSTEVFACRVRELIKVNVAKELAACEIPILYLQGAYDWVVPVSNLKRILTIKPSVRSVVISSSHMILKTQPNAAADAILTFMNQLRSWDQPKNQ